MIGVSGHGHVHIGIDLAFPPGQVPSGIERGRTDLPPQLFNAHQSRRRMDVRLHLPDIERKHGRAKTGVVESDIDVDQ